MVDEKKTNNFSNKNLINITIKSNIIEIDNTAFNGNDGIVFYIKTPNGQISGNPWGATNATVHWD